MDATLNFRPRRLNMHTPFKINDREISSQLSPYVIAEISGNHNGSLDKALKIVDAAHKAGAHAIKLQTYTADTMTIKSQKPDFMISNGLWAGKSLHELYEWAHTPWEWHEKIFQHAKDLGLTAFSSPFDDTAVDFLESLNVPAYKIASFELNDIPLIKKVALTGKPIILSTGMATLNEIKLAVKSIETTSQSPICLLHCVSGYPTPIDECNLNMINVLKESFDLPVGYSGHELGYLPTLAAVAMGAIAIERHYTLDNNMTGFDHKMSLNPKDFIAMIRDIAKIFGLSESQFDGIKESRKSSDKLNPYIVLGCSSNDDFATIRKKYLKLSKEHHPDVLMNKGVPQEVIEESKKKMRAINSAFDQIEKMKS